MTIAACYLSTEGVVLGADSTATMFVPGPGGQIGSSHHFNFAQKLFEFGERGSTIGIVLWGLGSLGDKSWRTLIAEIADKAKEKKLTSLEAVAQLASSMFWEHYISMFKDLLKQAKELDEKGEKRTDDENQNLFWLKERFSGGFFLGGRRQESRSPSAYEVWFGPLQTEATKPQPLPLRTLLLRGWPNLIERLLYGMDELLFYNILNSGKWTGSEDDLFELVGKRALGQPLDLPLREAIEWIYANIYTTITTMKFSHYEQICGGPIEIAVISTDRPFRWVCHKRMGEAITTGQTEEGSQ